MRPPPTRIQDLARKWIKGIISPEEKTEFMNWYNSIDDGKPLDIPKEFATDELTHSFRMFKSIFEKNLPAAEQEHVNLVDVHRTRRMKRWMRYAAAIIVILGAAIYIFTEKLTKNTVTVSTDKIISIHHDVKAPTLVHAMITLADGRTIVLDSIANGTITTQGNVELTKLQDGQIVYKGKSDQINYNTLTNPAGSKVIQITLSDGTKVWLNSKSSLRYPTAFTGKERLVEVTGETYFEVVANRLMPFRVRKEDMQIEVLGTGFNISAYEEEDKIKVTLMEGALNVSSGKDKSLQLKPGDQSQLHKNNRLVLVKGVDAEGVVAWKNGKFNFGEKTDIGSIMRQLARWYNLEIEFRGNISQHFGGSISRDVNLSQVLKILESTGGVKFEVQGNRVIVMP